MKSYIQVIDFNTLRLILGRKNSRYWCIYVDILIWYLTPTGYTLAQEGFRCEDIGMKATEELKSCIASATTIQKINPDIGTSVNERTLRNQPKGCYVAENTIFFNTDSTDVLNAGSRQVCSGKFSDFLSININTNQDYIYNLYTNFNFLIFSIEVQDATVTRQPTGTAVIQFHNVEKEKVIVTLMMIVLETWYAAAHVTAQTIVRMNSSIQEVFGLNLPTVALNLVRLIPKIISIMIFENIKWYKSLTSLNSY